MTANTRKVNIVRAAQRLLLRHGRGDAPAKPSNVPKVSEEQETQADEWDAVADSSRFVIVGGGKWHVS